MTPAEVEHTSLQITGPWYRQVNTTQWRAFWATFLGWVLDGFDFTIVTFILIDIQNTFTIDRALAGALGTVTLIMRFVGGAVAGTAADRWGRRLPLMISILWFSLFAGLSGFSTSYTMLFAFRALFGIGMGGEWAAGMPLVLEHWPARLRGIASGLLQAGYTWGFMLATFVFSFIYPLFLPYGELAWRAMFWIGILPALLVLWIRRNVAESPIWLERQKHLHQTQQQDPISLWRIFRRDLLSTTLQTSALVGSFMFSYYSITFWYATLLRDMGRATLPYLVALNSGAIVGCALFGQMSEGKLGRRGSAAIAAAGALLVVPLYAFSANAGLLALGALLMGMCGVGLWGILPTYLSERFPTAVRGVGSGFTYHAGAALGAFTPFVIGVLQDAGWKLPRALAVCIASSMVLVIAMLSAGPETRGTTFRAGEGA